MIKYIKGNNLIIADSESDIVKLKYFHKKKYGYGYKDNLYIKNKISFNKISYFIDIRLLLIIEDLIKYTNIQIQNEYENENENEKIIINKESFFINVLKKYK